MCWSQIRSPQNSTRSTILTLLLYSKNTTQNLAFTVVKRNEQIHRNREPYFGCCRFSFWSAEKHIAPRLRHVLAMSAPGRPEEAIYTRTTRNRRLRVLIQFATKWSLTLQVLSYVGGKNCKVFRLPKFWRMPKPPSWHARLLQP